MHSIRSFMLEALHTATRGQGRCAPNPAVGAVVVHNGQIVSSGYHRGPGFMHAEVAALKNLDKPLNHCELYVTLEPCCHHGRTPPCTDLILRSGISKVYFGYFDPNPLVAGKGQKQLQAAGISCERVPLEEVTDFYRAYHYWWQTKRPWVTLKLALTDQHQIALSALTGVPCQEYTQRKRLAHDALLTTVKTIRYDDPQYNVRLIDPTIQKSIYVLDRRAELPLSATILRTCHPVTIFYREALAERILALEKSGVRCIHVPLKGKQLDLDYCLTEIGQHGVHSLWIEAGWSASSSFIKQGFVHELMFYIAPANAKATARQISFVYEPAGQRRIDFTQLGDDVLIHVRPISP